MECVELCWWPYKVMVVIGGLTCIYWIFVASAWIYVKLEK